MDKEIEPRQYWGFLFQENNLGTERLNSLLSSIAGFIVENVEPTGRPDIMPSQLAAYYRMVGGQYDAMFLECDLSHLSTIYSSLGCSHSLQPEPSDDGFGKPTIPALLSKGFVIWETIMLLLNPDEHTVYLQAALQKFNLVDSKTREPFPKVLPRESFPEEPNGDMLQWYNAVAEPLGFEHKLEVEKPFSATPKSKEQRQIYQPLSYVKFDIRLLQLNPDNEKPDTLSYSLLHAPLFDAPPFTALSYCWGTREKKRNILLNGRNTKVTENLHAALLRLKEDRVEYAWVDALCIDQENMEERSIQVRRMGTIFRVALEVAVWLGVEQNADQPGLRFLSESDEATRRSPLPTFARQAMVNMMDRPYWDRVWIIQEIAVASNITVFCGAYKLPWAIFTDYNAGRSRAAPNLGLSWTQRNKFQSLQQFREDKISSKPISLLDALHRSRTALATDPKDKLYALLGITFDGDNFIAEPNYDQYSTETYTQFARALIQRGVVLDFIYLREASRHPSYEIPSWVPDWCNLNDMLAEQEFDLIRRCIIPSKDSADYSSRVILTDENELILDVRVLGHIPHLILTMDPPEPASLNSPEGVDRRGEHQNEHENARQSHVFYTLFGIRPDIDRGYHNPPYPPIFIWDYNDTQSLVKLLSRNFSPRARRFVLDWLRDNQSLSVYGKSIGDWAQTWPQGPENEEWEDWQRGCLVFLLRHVMAGLRLEVLKSGELCWVHPECKPGDVIVETPSCKSRLVLRPLQKHFHSVLIEERSHLSINSPNAKEESKLERATTQAYYLLIGEARLHLLPPNPSKAEEGPKFERVLIA